jgi:hypothetical protein
MYPRLKRREVQKAYSYPRISVRSTDCAGGPDTLRAVAERSHYQLTGRSVCHKSHSYSKTTGGGFNNVLSLAFVSWHFLPFLVLVSFSGQFAFLS